MSGPDDPERPAAGRSALPARLSDAADALSVRLHDSDSHAITRLRGADRVTLAVVGLVLVGLVVRFAFLGARSTHFDEGRVGYWILRYVETGEFHYRFIIHGPFVQHANAALFQFVEPNDFTLRIVVAVIGGLLPLSALLLREHLDGPEIVVVAFFFAADPAVLYYSRFFRSVIPVAAFAFVAFCLLVRFADTRRFRYLHGAAVFVALAFTAKENAAVYVLVWLGAGVLLLDHALFRPGSDETGLDRLRAWWGRNVRERDWRRAFPWYAGNALLSAALFVGVILYFYAPRTSAPDGVGLWTSLGRGEVGPLLSETWRTIEEGYSYWFSGGLQSGEAYASIGDRFLAYFSEFMETLLTAAGPLVAFAVLGFVVERYASRRRRPLVMFASYWGFVSVVGYPLAADIIGAAWTTVNAIVPLTIPAAVGVAMVYRWGVEARIDGDRVGAALVGVVLALVVFQVVATGASTSFVSHSSDDNALVQYAQPADDLQPTMADAGALAGANEGTDVLVYGEYLTDASTATEMEPSCMRLDNGLPLQWYFALADASTDCATSESELESALSEEPPPVVVAGTTDDAAVSERLPDYERRTLLLRTHGDTVSVFLDVDRLDDGG